MRNCLVAAVAVALMASAACARGAQTDGEVSIRSKLPDSQQTVAAETEPPQPDTAAETVDTVLAVEATAVADAGPDSLDATPTATDATATDASPALVDGPADTKAAPVPPSPAAQGGPIAVEIGGANDSGTQWAAWTTAGQPVPLVFGPQGGYHVWVSVCVPATTATPLAVHVAMTDTATKLPVPPGPLQVKTKAVALPDHPGQLCRLAMPGFVDCACEMAGRAVRVRVEVHTGAADKPVVSWAEHPIVLVHGKGPCLPPIQACVPFF